MIESPFHPCDEITRFGHTAHGLALNTQSTARLLVGGVEFPLPYPWPFQSGQSPEAYDTHLLRVPGVAPPDLTAEEVAAEAAKGRTWQNYTLLAEDRLVLFGKVLNGWVCIDPAGQRWLIRTTPWVNRSTIRADQPLTLTVSAVPFGYLDEAPVAPVSQAVTLADVGQGGGFLGPPSGNADPQVMEMRTGSVSSNGRRMVIELHGVQSVLLPNTLRINTAPAGFLLLELQGEGPAFELSLSVLRTREQVLGTYVEKRQFPNGYNLVFTWNTDTTPRTINGFPGVDAVASASGMEFVPSSSATFPLVGSDYVGDYRTGRIAALVFDDNDVLVELSYDASLRTDYDYPTFAGDVSGAVSGWIADGDNFTTTNVTSTVSGTYSRTSTEVVTGEIVLRRDGVEMARSHFEVHRTIDETVSFDPETTIGESLTRRPDGEIVGGGIRLNWTYHREESMSAVGETWPRPSFSGLQYSQGLWSGMIGTSSIKPHAYGVTLDYDNSADNDYAGATLTLQRYSNCIFGVRERLRPGVKPNKWRVPALMAPRALWLNEAGSDPGGGRGATYHPVTHEIFTTAATDRPSPFVWV